MRPVYNFSAGPAMLPEEVLQLAQAEMLNWHDTGMSIMELGHRGPEFQALAAESEANLRSLMSIPENYRVLFMPGGATAQFAMVPMNLTVQNKKVDYVDTGIWSKKAIAEAKRYADVNVVANCVTHDGLIDILHHKDWRLSKEAAYLHYTPNETIEGIEFHYIPETDKPLIADMSSMILSRPIDVSRYGIIYAGAQKNLGQAGIAVVIVREDLIGKAQPYTPTLYQYSIMNENHSFYNTPPTYSWYIMSLVLAWVKQKGGVDAMFAMNQRKAKKLYAMIDGSNGFYQNNIHTDCRSMTNIVFTLQNPQLEAVFLEQSKAANLTNLRGHRIVGGMRASLYNAMPEAGVDHLIEFMQEFLRKNG